jgi:phenylalanyl-tRNA synthetase alpha chain
LKNGHIANSEEPMSLQQDLELIYTTALKRLEEVDLAGLRDLYQEILGKRGRLTEALKSLKDLSVDEKRTIGPLANRYREELETQFRSRQTELQKKAEADRLNSEYYDALRPVARTSGHMHPLSRIQYEVEDIFLQMGFRLMDGPEVETDENNFGKLNFSEDHPARDMQDTFWTEEGFLLRTHTSSVQVRAMQSLRPPFRIIAPGRVYRYEETDASHENTFYQCEGMLVDRNISAAHLIHVMKTFLSAFFEREVTVRLRPGYFPFVEPGFELDIRCLICGGQGCPVCKQSGWVELLPCGLVHPNVLRAGGIDPEEWSGFAFGMGLSRLVMMRHEIEDIRHFLSGNLRFLQQFSG